MELYRQLSLLTGTDKAFISLIGGGGKTTLMIGYASYLRSIGKSVLMTTTTKIMSPSFHDYKADLMFSDDSVLSFRPNGPCAILYAIDNPDTRKWSCPPMQNLERLMDIYDVVINEADGSKRLPVKVHTSRDPVVPKFTTYTISVLGLWAIGKKTGDVAFGELRNLVVDKDYLNWIIQDREGLLKGSIKGRRAVVFNGAEEKDYSLVLRSLNYPEDVRVLAVSEKEERIYEQIQ